MLRSSKFLIMITIFFASFIDAHAENSYSQKCISKFSDYVFSELIGDGKYSDEYHMWWWIPGDVLT